MTTSTLTRTTAATQTQHLPNPNPLDTSTNPTFQQLLKQYSDTLIEAETAWYNAINEEQSNPIQNTPTNATSQPTQWLWQQRIPLTGLTLLDGDHSCGKSLLALRIAAAISSGTPMFDGTPTIQGGVIIISPVTSPSVAQIPHLTAFGADLSRIEILSFIPNPEENSKSNNSHNHPFTFPEDITPLLNAIDRIDARLIILDPFTFLLSRNNRWTNQRLSHLLIDLNQLLIQRNIACLLIRNCTAKGGHARPSALERSDHFPTTAVSRLLLAPDPMQPDQLLLSHALSSHSSLTPTLTLKIQPHPTHPALPQITLHGHHILNAQDLIENRPNTLHRRLLAKNLLHIICQTTDPTPISTLYAQSPHSSIFQIQRALNDLRNLGQIQRPTRGFYTQAPTNPTFPLDATATTTPEPTDKLKVIAATTSTSEPTDKLKVIAATTSTSEPTDKLKVVAATTSTSEPTDKLKVVAATTQTSEPTNKLKAVAATSSNLRPPHPHKRSKSHKNPKKRR